MSGQYTATEPARPGHRPGEANSSSTTQRSCDGRINPPLPVPNLQALWQASATPVDVMLRSAPPGSASPGMLERLRPGHPLRSVSRSPLAAAGGVSLQRLPRAPSKLLDVRSAPGAPAWALAWSSARPAATSFLVRTLRASERVWGCFRSCDAPVLGFAALLRRPCECPAPAAPAALPTLPLHHWRSLQQAARALVLSRRAQPPSLPLPPSHRPCPLVDWSCAVENHDGQNIYACQTWCA